MKDRLPSEYHLSLDTIRILKQDDLQIAIYRLAQMYNTTFGMIMPPLNHNLLLLHYVRSLALPIEVYTMARRLNLITKYNFSYPDGTSTSTETTRRQATTFPEAQLISLVVVTTKLLFPFDSDTVKRYPKEPNEPTTLRMKWSAWLAAKHSFDKAFPSDDTTDLDGLQPGAEIHVTDSDIFRMSDKQLDQYMDWYQRTWIKSSSDAGSQARQSQSQSQQESALDREILDMFPLHDGQEIVKTGAHDQQARLDEQSRLDARIREVQASLLPRRAISSEEEVERGLELLRPGAMYPRYRHVEDLDLDNKAAAAAAAEPVVVRIFHEEVAQTACLSIKALVKAVNKSEQRIEHWLREKRRREVFSEESTDEDLGHHDDDGGGDDDDDNLLATSPPGKLASEMEGLQLGRSSGIHDGLDIDVDVDMDMDMEMLPELEMQAGPSTQ
jgi:RNA polymerase I-specific transcription initiation factor RRN7